jgi:hypothetical protein
LYIGTRSKTKSEPITTPKSKRKRDVKAAYKSESQVNVKIEELDRNNSLELNSDDVPNDFEFNDDESAINNGSQSVKKENFSFDHKDNDEDQKCVMCHTSKKKTIELTCKHKVHKGCLLNRIQQGLVNSKYKIK